MNAILEYSVEVAVYLLLALAARQLLRRSAAAIRHRLIVAALVVAAITPLLGRVAPEWGWQVARPRWMEPRSTEPRASVTTTVEITPPGAVASPNLPGLAAAAVASAPANAARTWPSLLVFWLVGIAFSLAILIAGGVRLSRIARRAALLSDERWSTVAEQILAARGLRRRVTLLAGDDPDMLVTWGFLRPRIIVPPSALAWPEARIRAVLLHELAHIRRGDWIVQLGAELLRAVYWFNPLTWVACNRLRHDSEHACDDEVLSDGVAACDYAADLVDIARDFRGPARWAAAHSIAERSTLERRITSMLDSTRSHQPVSRSTSVAILTFALAGALSIAGFAAAQAFSKLSGTLVDPSNAFLPGVTVALTNKATEAKYEVKTDREGRYEFVGLPAGEYELVTKLAGFEALRSGVVVTGRDLTQDFTLQVGTLQETISIVASANEVERAPAPNQDREAELEKLRKRVAESRCPGAATAPPGTPRLGGNIRAPMKIKDVKPRYPDSLRGTGTDGTVVLKASIGTEGTVEDLTVISSPHPDLTEAAMAAVRQWQFTATMLNCEAIPVTMNVTANFRYEP